MFAPPLPLNAKDWQQLIEHAVSDRCDLDVLLKDEWRHKVAVRDDSRATGPNKEQFFVIDGQHYATLKGLLLNNNRMSVGAFVLTAFHSVLGAYGHGSRTVVAYVEAVAKHNLQASKLLPTIVDHVQRPEFTCIEAVEAIERALQQGDAYTDPRELLQRGLFDAVLVLTDDDNPLADMPPFPLAAIVRDGETRGCLQWTVAYAADLFEDKVIAGLLEVLREVLNQIAFLPTQQVGNLEFISEQQKRQLDAWNTTDGDFPTDKRLNELFEDAVQRSPDLEAIVSGNTRFTYSELNERCNHFAHWLLRLAGVRPHELIALCLDKSDLVVVATLGIWKAGAAYVPIDPSYPADRIHFTLRDTQATRIVSNRHHAARLREMLSSGQPTVEIIEVETVLEEQAIANLRGEDPRLGLHSEQIAYVTYTSGTTGVPKGVAKDHRSVVNSITDLSERYDMLRAGEERVALFAAFVFEPFMRQTLIALINSQTLVVVPDDMKLDPNRFPAFVAQHGITYLNGTGSVLRHFDLLGCRSLKRMLLVGEEVTAPGLRQLREKFAGHIINEYSFTETAFVTAIKEFAPGVVERTDRSIGRPIRNVKCYVLTGNLKQVPIGAIGELYIGGRGIARGYLNRDELTAERFLANPFQTKQDKLRGHNERIYKTGDLARMLPNGEIEFLGRSDFQLKLNGVRVEPGEIEARAMEYPGVRQCVVVAREGIGGADDRHLIGYFVAEESSEVTEADLRAFLEMLLIRVMVPARMVRLPGFPVNVNGKVDRRALPDVGPLGSAAKDICTNGAASEPATAASSLASSLRDIWSAVLGVPAASIHTCDNFFMLGGHSISCLQLIMRVWQRLRLVVSVEDVFKMKTLGNLADHLERQKPDPPQPGPSLADADTPVAGRSVKLRANGLQQGLMYHALKRTQGDDAYVVQSVYRYRSAIRSGLLEQAWRYAQRKYSSLRLRFEWGEEALQIIDADEKPLEWRFVDLSAVADNETQDAHIRDLQERDRTEPYTLATGPLFRVYLIKQRDDLFVFIFSCHHIILDGWSLPILHDDVHRMYLRLTQDAAVDPTIETAYVAAQRYWEAHRGDHVDYWTGQVERIADRCDFSGLLNEQSRYKVALRSYDHVLEHKTKKLGIGVNRTSALKVACAANHFTLHSVLQFVWHKVLYAIGGARTTVAGTIVSGRNLPIDGIESSVGLFINTLPLIVDHDEQATKTVAAAVADIQEAANKMNSRSTVELGQLQSGEMKRRLFDTLLVLENYPRLLNDDEARQHSDLLRFERYYDSDKVDYPLAVVAREEGGEFTVSLWYAGELFDDSAIDTLLDAAQTLFGQVAEDFSQPVRNLEYVSAAVQAKFDAWNRTEAPFPEDKTLHGAFEEVAARWPGEVAVVYGSTRLTYGELNERANQMAHYLLAAAELRPNDLVALVMDKSERMVVAIVAVWKAGAAYVPIDPGYPNDRVAFMLDDTRARLVVADEAHGDRLRRLPGGAARPVLGVERLPLDGQHRGNPVTGTSGTDLAYAIYTSGTTGRPKAVLIEHRNVVSFRNDLTARYFGETEAPRQAVLLLANYVFDFSIEQLVLSILSGHKLIVPPTLPILDDDFYDYANRHGLTYLSGTPTHVQQFDLSRLKYLQQVLVAGEGFQAHHFAKIRREYFGPLLNAYGTTETTVYNTVKRFEPGEAYRNTLGEPLSNTRLYILNRELQLLPTGAVGELFIAGDCVSAGYLNQTELTRERFFPNPFQTGVEQRKGRCAVMYKTGDVVRRRVDGDLEFLGRNDSQVKIHGLRVEIGEVEAALASYPGVRQCAVVACEDNGSPGSKRLVGYYVADGAAIIEEGEVFAFLRAKLTLSMVPALLRRIDGALPITINGKLDLGALPSVDFSEKRVLFAAPRNRLESRLYQMWCKLLPGGVVGIDDDFFRCGGDSITVLQLASQMQRELKRKVSVKYIFDFSTIRSFVDNALSGTADELSSSEQGPLTGACPMLPIQEWFFGKRLGSRGHWNQYFAIRTPPLDLYKLREALDRLVDHHDAFRLRFRSPAGGGAGKVEQFYSDGHAEVLLHALNVRGLRVEEVRSHLEKWQSGFDLEGGPLCCAAYLHEFDDGTARVWVALHHLIVDVVSWRILTQDLEILYHGGDLGPRGSSYRQWAQALQSYAPATDEPQVWAEVAAGVAAGAGGALSVAEGGAHSYRERFALGEGETQTLLVDSNRAYDTQINDLLLTAVGFALRTFTQQTTNYVTLEGHGRELLDGAPDVRDTVGWFTTMHPVAVEVCENLGRSIGLTKASRMRVPHNGIGYGALRGTYGGDRAPLPPVSFNYLGRFDDGATAERPYAPVESSGWRLDTAMCGSSLAAIDKNASNCAIDVTMSCVGGRMVAEVDSRLGQAATQRFSTELKARLEEIIAHTLNVAAGRSGRGKADAAPASLDFNGFDPYILANEGEAGPMLFLLPPGEGGAESYLNNIARHLPGLRLVLFNNVHLLRPMDSFEALARYYIAHVRRLQPSGPYNFLGWSFGGVLSLELALQLTRTGETISNLLFIDSFFNMKKASTDIGLPEVDNCIDPINYRYMPTETDLERCRASTGNVVLFKVAKSSDRFEGDNQRRLFEYYTRSPYNNLETLLPPSSIAVEILLGDTHFSWVRNESSVAAIGSRVTGLVQGTVRA